MQRLFQPGVWFVNLFVRPLLLLVGIRPGESTEIEKLTPEAPPACGATLKVSGSKAQAELKLETMKLAAAAKEAKV